MAAYITRYNFLSMKNNYATNFNETFNKNRECRQMKNSEHF